MEAIVLAGGFGTRLKELVNDLPKPMADINGKPFLEYLLTWLSRNGVDHTILAVGYKADTIEKHFGNEFMGMKLNYSHEFEPLGTGGAIKKAFIKLKNRNKPAFIVNGDTFFDVDLKQFYDFHHQNKSQFSIVVKKMFNFDRYGSVEIEDNKISKFKEKTFKEVGFINGGIYLMNQSCLQLLPKKDKFSFENSFMERYVCDLAFGALVSDGYFIDIGIPEDYFKAIQQLPFRL
ncbi:nucleotidyltransferase family protein [Marinifilum sp.]|uniref:nucleotidyltransferase family protein n=1 Tax=Marinifilum sp. TaxID=2033137 RepID=UPI003BADBACF